MKHISFIASLVLISCQMLSQPTVGLLKHDPGDLDTGYVLFAPMVGCSTTYLIDKCGRLVHSWNGSYSPQISTYLLEDGSLLRGGGGNGIIDKIDWDGKKVFFYTIFNNSEIQHHDIKLLPNGNILAIVRDIKTKSEAIAAGRNPNNLGTDLFSEKIIEIKPIDKDTYDIVWEWRAWDHLIQRYDSNKANYGFIKDHPELINLNYLLSKQQDIFHFNCIDYNSEFNQILISVPMTSEIWIIDHSTTTAEAASHSGGNRGKGGDLLYRWGNPATYNRGTTANQKLYSVHNAEWLESGLRYAGSIMLFNNGIGRTGGNYSSVEIITSPVDALGEYDPTIPYLPLTQSWIYKDSIPKNFYAMNMSSAQQLINGNVLICDATKGTFFEIDSNGKTLWKYRNPVSDKGIVSQGTTTNYSNSVFRCKFYPSDYSAFNGRQLVSSGPIELNPLPYFCHLDPPPVGTDIQNQVTPLISQYSDQIYITLPTNEFDVKLVNLYGQQIYSGHNANHISTVGLKNGLYLILINTPNGDMFTEKIIIDN